MAGLQLFDADACSLRSSARSGLHSKHGLTCDIKWPLLPPELSLQSLSSLSGLAATYDSVQH